jgi:hypothetical protein
LLMYALISPRFTLFLLLNEWLGGKAPPNL